jgi:hypothetical protein
MNLRKMSLRLLGPVAALALAGCLISEEPLLDTRNGRAAPLDSGMYDACEYDSGEPECRKMDVRLGKAGLYEFRTEEDDDLTYVRFRRIGRGVWLAQLIGEGDEDYFYFLSETTGDDFAMAMIVCGDIPEAVRAKYSARGEMKVDDDASVCEVKTLRAATASALAYRKATDPGTRSRIVYRKLAEHQE